MFEITATEARKRQQAQLDYYRDIWPAEIHKEIERRCAEAWATFEGSADELAPSWKFNSTVPRGATFEQWREDLRNQSL